MLMPRVFAKPVIDDFFDSTFTGYRQGLMKTDVKETGDSYEMSMDLPGVDKENVEIELIDGYLNISASRNYENSDEKENFIYRERYSGAVNRSFYVGDSVTEDDIKASFDNGILKIDVPKKEEKKNLHRRLIHID